jgi:hypothetical protein
MHLPRLAAVEQYAAAKNGGILEIQVRSKHLTMNGDAVMSTKEELINEIEETPEPRLSDGRTDGRPDRLFLNAYIER